ncbi:MAG TPA: SMEK domain-containing protein [Candidatus Moranbacteria bacterium]|nr:SMEK domain-containing protein [Candidatus Moranbacteria bacterium]
MFSSETKTKEIIDSLVRLSREVEICNGAGFFDGNKCAEDFFKGILNRVYDCNLINLNLEKNNFPAIDLGDKSKKLAIQVTASIGRTKISNSITKFVNHNLCDTYKKPIFLIIGKKPKYSKNFDTDTKGKFIFNPSEDILDITDLIKIISSLPIEKITDINKFIISNITEVLSVDPIKINEQDIKNLILGIRDVINDDTSFKPKYSSDIPMRFQDYIVEKNKLNEIDKLFFEQVFARSLKYSDDIKNFLSDPINVEIKEWYFTISSELQNEYVKNREKFDLLEFIDKIYDKVCEKFKADLSYDKRKIKVMLHCMYFHCDLGINPEKKT